MAASARLSHEAIDVRTADGWSLRADLTEPGGAARGVAVLAHALMTRRTASDRPRGAGLARFLAESGWCAVAFDFRGHGDSAPTDGAGRGIGYDDFVRGDLPAVCDFARWRAGGLPLVLVGHSLGGAVALASAATGAVEADAIVAIAANVWLPELEPSRAVWAAKRALLGASLGLARPLGRAPARLLRLGSDDETLGVLADLARFARRGRWESAGGEDYLAALARLRAPALEVVSDGDRFECSPESGGRFAARCGGRCEVLRVAEGDGGTRPPSHMGLVTGGRARTAWGHVEAWMRAATSRVSGSR